MNTHVPSPSNSFMSKFFSKFFAIFRKDLNMALPSDHIYRVIHDYAYWIGTYDADNIGSPYH